MYIYTSFDMLFNNEHGDFTIDTQSHGVLVGQDAIINCYAESGWELHSLVPRLYRASGVNEFAFTKFDSNSTGTLEAPDTWLVQCYRVTLKQRTE